jgi:hypothetical protein
MEREDVFQSCGSVQRDAVVTLSLLTDISFRGWNRFWLPQQRKITMSANPLIKKLGLKPGMRALVMAAPEGYLNRLTPLPEGVDIATMPTATYEFVQFFATRMAEIEKTAPGLLQRAAPGAVFWITYPKKTSGIESDLSRDILAAAMTDKGWRPVSIVALDDVWSALRFRPIADVKSKKKAK